MLDRTFCHGAGKALPSILEIKRTLAGQRKEFRCRLVEREADSAVVLFVSRADLPGGHLTLPPGTVTLGHFWPARAYNVYHWLTPAGATLAHYFNLADDTAIDEATIRWRDLAVDVLVQPGRPARRARRGRAARRPDPATAGPHRGAPTGRARCSSTRGGRRARSRAPTSLWPRALREWSRSMITAGAAGEPGRGPRRRRGGGRDRPRPAAARGRRAGRHRAPTPTPPPARWRRCGSSPASTPWTCRSRTSAGPAWWSASSRWPALCARATAPASRRRGAGAGPRPLRAGGRQAGRRGHAGGHRPVRRR